MAPIVARFLPLACLLECAASLRQTSETDPGILYGIETCGAESYEAMLQAQLDTWARNLSRESLIIVAGPKDDFYEGHAASLPGCPDELEAVACKEGVLLDRAIDRARLLNSHWLVVGQEDKYIWTQELEDALRDFNATVPQVFAVTGCGQAWEHHSESASGTKPKPDMFVQPNFSCQNVWEHGGICGGPTYIVSRGALELLRRPDQNSHAFLNEILSLNSNRRASDLSASCLFHERGIPLIHEASVVPRLAEIATTTPASDSREHVATAARNEMRRMRRPPLAIHIALPKQWVPGFIHALDDLNVRSSAVQSLRAQQSSHMWRSALQPHSFY